MQKSLDGMSEAECDFESIKILFNQLEERQPIKIKDKLKTKEIIAFDTETVEGKAVLVAASDNKFIFPNSFEEIAEFLTQRRYNTKLNFFWNIDFDFFAIIKWLPTELIEILYENKGLIYSNYFIRWIPRKFFSITRIKSKRTSNFYDLWQFYRMSLNEAAKRYLNDSKIEIDVENIEQYLKKPQLRQKLIQYCVKDAQLTAQLGNILQKKLNNLGIDFSKPFSCGYISTTYFFKGKETFGFKKTEWELYALLSYYGGRFEVLKRGYFSKIYQYDINSAYPFYISKLINPFKGTWIKSKDLDYSADYGFARIEIKNYENDQIAPLPWRLKNKTVIFPNFQNSTEYYVAFPELETAEKLGLQFDVIDSWAFYGEGEQLFPQINELYSKRKEAKKVGDKTLELVLKILMNSLYGKFAEKQISVRASLKQMPNSKEIEIDGQKFFVREINKPGLLFCPVLASYITAQTRSQLIQSCKGHFDHIIAFATDSILTTKPFLEESNDLGAWKLETTGEAIILMSGVYTIKNSNEIKTRFRGFPLYGIDFFELLEKNRYNDKIYFEFEKALKLGEVVSFHHKYSLEDLNIFRPIMKELTCYSDEKRNWLSQPLNFNDLLENQFDSVPKTVSASSELWKKRSYLGYRKMIYDWQRTREIEETAWLFERMML
jgi:hypothetical protein